MAIKKKTLASGTKRSASGAGSPKTAAVPEESNRPRGPVSIRQVVAKKLAVEKLLMAKRLS